MFNSKSMHYHKCGDGCEAVWFHSNKMQGDEEAHRCPSCKTITREEGEEATDNFYKYRASELSYSERSEAIQSPRNEKKAWIEAMMAKWDDWSC